MGGSRELASKRCREHTRLFIREQCFNVVVWSQRRWYLTAIEVAKRDLEAVDTKTKISQNELGFHALKNSGTFSRRATYGVVPCR